ncbi:MAG: type transport system ATP-binding protein [Thermoleophilaceae bacterium]|nr:type transport system ATP-binding protein [Thermoleophilaceae bacterium]
MRLGEGVRLAGPDAGTFVAMSTSRDQLPAVYVDSVSKQFKLPRERVHTLKERALHVFRDRSEDSFEALRDVSFDVRPGEFFGIVGRNGSGKSTLLKCLAGIYRTDGGRIFVNGRLSTFIELGVGFNPDLAARDNVTLNAIMLGLSPKEARARFDRVIEFAELEEFVDLKLKNYSSGMQVRLAFSVMIQADADILLVDEVLAVGDASFQQKCFDVFQGLKDAGKTILFVTHDMGAVQRFCDRAVLIERGEMKIIGEPDRVASHYVELNFGREGGATSAAAGEERYGSQEAQVVEAWFEDEHGARTTSLSQARPCTFRARIEFGAAMDNPAVAVLFENDRHHPLFAASTDVLNRGDTGSYAAGESAVFSVSFDNRFALGRIYATPWIVHRRGAELADRRPRMVTAVTTGTHNSGGIVDLPHDVALERTGAGTGAGVVA